MIAYWMLYAAAVAALLGAAALAGERVAQLLGRPQRWIWAASVAASLLVPVLVPLLGAYAAARAPLLPAVVPMSLDPTATLLPDPARPAPVDWALWLDRSLGAGWMLASLAGAAWLLSATATLRRERRGWRAATVAGAPVLVSRDTGPAVVGHRRCEIVLPEWVMGWDEARQALIVAHEREHIRARDPLLMLCSLVALLLAPWSPALWWQVHRLRLAVEVDCDRRVLRGRSDVRRYGALLLEVGRRGGRGALPVAAFSEPASFLARRIHMMTWKQPRRRAGQVTALLGAVLVAPLALHALPVAGHPALERLAQRIAAQAPAAAPSVAPSNAPTVAPASGPAAGPASAPVGVRGSTGPVGTTPGVEAARKAGRISGRVTDAAGRPVAGAEVTVAGIARGARTRADGRFLLDGVPAGRHTLRVVPPGPGGAQTVEVTVRADQAVTVDVVLAVVRGAPTGHGAAPDAIDHAYEVAELERAPELINQAEVASLMNRLYPKALHDAGVSGRAVVQFVITAQGTVDGSTIKVVSAPHPQLGEASVKAVEQFRFRPGVYQGRPVRVLIQMPVSWQPRVADFSGVPAANPAGGASAKGAERAYEVAELDDAPKLVNQAEVASLMNRLYPKALHDAGVSGKAMVQFAVTAQGVVDPGSIKVISATHEQFGEASVKVAEQFSFRPGRYKGRAVRVLIQMPLTWEPRS